MCTTRSDVMLRKLDKRSELKKKIDELEYELGEIEDYIKNSMKKDGKDEIIVGPYRVTYKEVVQNKFDSKLFREENGEVYESYKRPTTQKRFSVYE